MNTKVNNVTILIVEDSPLQAELLRRILEEAGYKVLHAKNGEEGLKLARTNGPAVVVTDINMPVMDGYELCRSIRQDETLRTIPVILLTMLSDPLDVIRGLNAGADAYFTKPYTIATLVEHIESLIASPLVVPPEVERRKIEVRMGGKTYVVHTHSQRMLSLLVSTYENAVLQNRELMATQKALEDLNRTLEYKVAERTTELQESERRFRSMIENATDLVFVLDTSGKISYVSPSMMQISGYEVDEVMGSNFIDFIDPGNETAAKEIFSEILDNPDTLHTFDFRFRQKDGNWIIVESIAKNALSDQAVQGIIVNSRDVTEARRADAKLKHLNWALRALGQSNSALVRASDEEKLFSDCCDAIVGSEGYALAWIGAVRDDPACKIEILAAAGEALKYMDVYQGSCIDTTAGECPCTVAIRTGTVQIVNDLTNNTDYVVWLEKIKASGLASSACVPIRVDGTIFGVMTVYSREQGTFGDAEIELLNELASDIGYGISSRRTRLAYEAGVQEQAQQAIKLREIFESAIGALALTVEQRDPYTAGHQRRVAELAVAIGRELELEERRLEGLRVAGIIHDIGKISVPAEILSKPGKLSAAEFEIVKGHAQAGYDIVKGVDFPWPVAQMIWQHHERLDGSGYPQQLQGDGIILEARILAVADIVEAMSTHRPYRPGLGIDTALAQLKKEAGTRLDPAVVEVCERLFNEKGYELPA